MRIIISIGALRLKLLLTIIDVEVLVGGGHHFAQIAFSNRLLHIPLAAHIF
jgi:hypothetical protein